MTTPAISPRLAPTHEAPALFFDSDLCVKCNICTAACPVAAATERFPGPKTVGPQTARFRQPDRPIVDPDVVWCSGCGVCSRVCPHGVPVAEMNILAKTELRPTARLALRDWALARPPELARVMRVVRPLARFALHAPALRAAADRLIGLARAAPLPDVASASLRRRQAARVRREPSHPSPDRRPRVAFFHGCSTQDYEPWLGEMTILVLERLGVEVELPPQACCGLPLQSNHDLEGARRRARFNLASLHPWAERGLPIVGTSTSCTLALKHEYRAILGLTGPQVEAVSESTYDFFEYLDQVLLPTISEPAWNPVPLHVLYHPPCQLRSHRIGSPALRILRRIPELRIEVSLSECCGVAGTYGLKSERYAVAAAVGADLFDQIHRTSVVRVLTDSETCRWWIERHADVPALHPVEILASALGLPSLRPTGSA